MKRKIAYGLKIFILLLPIWIIFLPLFLAVKFYIFKIEILALSFLYLYFACSFLGKKETKLFPFLPIPKFVRTSIFYSFISSAAITIWYYIEGYFGNELINWFNEKISIPLFKKVYIQPQNLMAGQIGFISIFFALFILILLVYIGIYYLDKTPNKKYFSKFKSISLYLSLLSILACLFSTELFQNNAGRASTIFFGGTEDYIRYRIRSGLSFIEDLKKYGGFNYGIFPYEAGDEFIVYMSQTGFWGSVLKFIQSLFNIDPEIFLLGTRITLSLIYSNIILWIGYKLKQKFGFISALLFILPQVFIFWILGPVKHIIWFYPLLFAPFLHSLIRYPKVIVKEISQKRFLIEGLIIFILVFLRGYTYLSNIILSAMVPVIFLELQEKTTVKDIFRKILPIGIAGGGSLLIVLGLHLIQLVLYLGSISEATQHLSVRTVQRTGFQDPTSYWQLFKHWMNVRFLYFPKTTLFSFEYWQNMNQEITLGTIHYFYLFIFLITGYLKSQADKLKSSKLKTHIQTLYPVGIATLFSIFASWSWFVNKGHMRPHSHMNGIMYIVPFGFCLFIFFGIFVQTLLEYLDYLSIKEVSEN